jgi:hypothetical protein
MVKDVVALLDISRCAEISLILFFVVFVATSLRAWTMPRREALRISENALSDGERRS